MKVVLVTGSTGALGRAVVERIRKDGHFHVVEAGRSPSNEHGIVLDVRNSEQITDVINKIKPDLILHLAATYVNEFSEAYAVNVEAARHVMNAIMHLRSCSRVLLIGSAAEYGIVKPEENPIREDRILKPVSLYGLTKAWQTQLAGLYAHYGVDVVVARIFNLNGPKMNKSLFIGHLQKQIEEVLSGRRTIIEVGLLTSLRDYVSTNEAALQILKIAECGETGHVYHVASGIPISIRDILYQYLAEYNIDETIVKESAELTTHTGYSIQEIYADVTRTKQLMQKMKVK